MREEDIKSDAVPKKVDQELDTPGKIMVTGIPKRKDYANAELEKEFAPYGRITEVNIIRDKRTSIPRGFAFVTYENPQDSEDAIKAMEGKDLGGESAVHCEQAVIGYRKSKMMNEGPQGSRGASRGRGGRGLDRGRGRGMDRGRRADRGRGMFNREMREDMQRGRQRFHEEMQRMYSEEEYYEEFYEPEPMYMEFPPRRGAPLRGGPPIRRSLPIRGGMPGRGRPFSQGPPVHGSRKVLLPDPPARGSGSGPYPGQMWGPPQEEYYGDEDNGYTGGDYYEDPYAEGYEEPYSEEVDYTAEEYYDREWPQRPRGRGTTVARGRGLTPRGGTEARAAPRNQLEDYRYPEDTVPHQRSRAPAGPPARRSIPAYSEDMYDEENTEVAPIPADSYSRGRGRPSLAAVPMASSARLGRGTPGNRSGVPAIRGGTPASRVGTPRGRGATSATRTGLFDQDPYAQEDTGMYERAPPPSASVKAAALDYDEDAYGDAFRRKISPAVARQAAPSRIRSLMPLDDLYAGSERVQPKALMGGDAMTARRATMAGAASRYVDDYQSLEAITPQAREAYAEGRRPVARRIDSDSRMIQDPYRRVSSETDAYASYPERVPPESLSSDPYNRKRSLEVYADASTLSGPTRRREYDDYRTPVAVPVKRERTDRGDRSTYETYTPRLEDAYRGL